jgi:hypothetical protein
MADSAALYPHDWNACCDNDMHTRGSKFGSPSSAERGFFFFSAELFGQDIRVQKCNTAVREKGPHLLKAHTGHELDAVNIGPVLADGWQGNTRVGICGGQWRLECRLHLLRRPGGSGNAYGPISTGV